MSVLEVRELARVVIDAGGNLADLRELTARWAASVRPSPVALCKCISRRARAREWRRHGEAVDVTFVYLTHKAYHAAAQQPRTERRGVIAKGPASGWLWEATPRDHGHPWTCALCHPPVDGLDVEYRDVRDGDIVVSDGGIIGRRALGFHQSPGEIEVAGRLQWRPGYGWRRDGQPDGDPPPAVKAKPDAWFQRDRPV